LRNKFSKFYNKDSIVVSHPVLPKKIQSDISQKYFFNDEKIILFYPAYPRSFKNFEVVCKAISLLSEKDQKNIELRLTIDGSENHYSRYIYNNYISFASIKFIGLKNKAQIFDEYNNASVIIFPSKLETWGLPISEAKDLNKPLLVSDLHYARETVGNYDMVSFLSPNDPQKWADCFNAIIDGKFQFSGNNHIAPSEPFAKDWDSLSLFLLNI
jgi:glycosyltransferase involved in cell wall biosynthesis